MALFGRKKELTPEEANKLQMMRRQSAPRDTSAPSDTTAPGVINGFKAITRPIDKKQIAEAYQILQRYKQGKSNLDKRIIDNEQWYKLRHWECMRDKKQDVQPSSAWLFNAIANKHADAMDNIPSCNVLPREESDKGEAEMLSSIIPVILDQCDFEEVYSALWTHKLKSGTGVYGVFWDKEKLNGLGDISVKRVDILSLYFEPGITDIQDSRHLFNLKLVDDDVLLQMYPQLEGKLGGRGVEVARYIYDDTVDTNNKSCVIDWYYKKRANGKTVLHYCKFVNDEVLFATENEPKFAERGLYDHGLYPFVFDPLYIVEGTPAGFGYIDVGKDNQAYIDRINQCILRNTLFNSKPRFFVREDAGINEEDFADSDKEIIKVFGNINDTNIMPIKGNTLNDIYVSVLNSKIDELKETTGNRDVSQGGTTGGVTSAAGIAAQQEAGAKLSRQDNKGSYRAFKRVCLMIVELIRQFYDTSRSFRILGQDGMAQYVQYSNANIAPQSNGTDLGMDMGFRVPYFDLEIVASRQTAYSRMAVNDLALQFFGAGFFNPVIADQALACLDMMDFDRKEFLMQKIARNAMIYRQTMMAMPAPIPSGDADAEKSAALGGEEHTEPAATRKSRQRVAESTSPT
jgi:hypothetical protein